MPGPVSACLATVVAALVFCGAAGAASTGRQGGNDFALTATRIGPRYAPTFTGNGMLGVRVPPAGQGYAPGTVPAQSELAGFYAQPPKEVQQRANIPTWSTLTFADGGKAFDPKAPGTSGWKQTLDLRTGVIKTSATWRAPDGHVTDLTYEVLTDRARPDVGVARLRVDPQWSGTATVTDRFDGRPANIDVEGKRAKLTTEVGKGLEPDGVGQWLTVAAVGTGIEATLADRLATGVDVLATEQPIDTSKPESIGRRLRFRVRRGESYIFTKFVAVEDSEEGADFTAKAREDVAAAAAEGYLRLREHSDAAWKKLWDGRIEVRGNKTLAADVDASQFYLWSSTNRGIDWSVSPAGLSSNGYNGHIFWDAETWMYPSLLAQHPELAVGMDEYRYDRLAAARAHAKATGWAGARFPWESALDGTEQIPPPVSVNSEGLYEQHVVADVALAQWQYYLATGDREWLRTRGWPVIEGAAEFWASRARRGSDGAFHLDHVTGPDEENPNVKDEVFTDVAARTVLEDAASAAAVLGESTPARWSNVARGLVVPFDPALGFHPEFDGYGGQLVKQADVTLVQYPWDFPMPAKVARADLDHYVPRSDPGGPSMTDAVSMIDTAALGVPGCSSYVFTRRSYEPFIKDVFDQFSETREGGAFTFMTGIGGFLQEFLYGYSGMRWDAGAVRLDPSLNAGVGEIVLHHLRRRGRVFDVAIGAHRTTVTLDSGPPLPVRVGSGGAKRVSVGHPLAVPTRRPDLAPTDDPLRCTAASATSTEPGAPALAAVDGSPSTQWQAESLPASLTVPLHGAHRIDGATVRWGHAWQPAPKPNVHPPAKPVLTRRATDYVLLGSRDGSEWKPLAKVSGRSRGTVDHLNCVPNSVGYVRLAVTAATKGVEGREEPPLLEELEARG